MLSIEDRVNVGLPSVTASSPKPPNMFNDYEYYSDSDEGDVYLYGRDRELQNAVLYNKDIGAAERAIAAGANVNARDDHSGTILQAAVQGGNEAIVRLLLSHGAIVNDRGGVVHGKAVTIAAKRGDNAILQLLLDNGGDANGAMPGHVYGPEPPLHAASEGAKRETVELLLRHGADVNGVGGMYGTALEAACHYGYEPTVRVLLAAGADVNLQGGYHGDALQAAARYGRMELVKILLQAGADPTAQCGVCGSALQGAKERGHPEVAKLLEAAINEWQSNRMGILGRVRSVAAQASAWIVDW